mmetsp:Transcript_1640/g.4935  ORF Transcript_1640/g.4935 Transcript_1640/m.4935 type:complete len:403 (+) Transcript_1640:443-1651(+)
MRLQCGGARAQVHRRLPRGFGAELDPRDEALVETYGPRGGARGGRRRAAPQRLLRRRRRGLRRAVPEAKDASHASGRRRRRRNRRHRPLRALPFGAQACACHLLRELPRERGAFERPPRRRAFGLRRGAPTQGRRRDAARGGHCRVPGAEALAGDGDAAPKWPRRAAPALVSLRPSRRRGGQGRRRLWRRLEGGAARVDAAQVARRLRAAQGELAAKGGLARRAQGRREAPRGALCANVRRRGQKAGRVGPPRRRHSAPPLLVALLRRRLGPRPLPKVAPHCIAARRPAAAVPRRARRRRVSVFKGPRRGSRALPPARLALRAPRRPRVPGRARGHCAAHQRAGGGGRALCDTALDPRGRRRPDAHRRVQARPLRAVVEPRRGRAGRGARLARRPEAARAHL